MGYRICGRPSGDDMRNSDIERRRKLAKLPFEKKIEILLRLQEIARFMRRASGRKGLKVWRIKS